ncbi:MAG: hypothetical protein ACREUN_13840, partial [Burkholderiales bacterium]
GHASGALAENCSDPFFAAMNLYAPPKAKVDPAHQLGELWRRDKLVRMDRSGALPDRCVICNADAAGYRLPRKLYWAPTAWRIGATATPFVVLGSASSRRHRFSSGCSCRSRWC